MDELFQLFLQTIQMFVNASFTTQVLTLIFLLLVLVVLKR